MRKKDCSLERYNSDKCHKVILETVCAGDTVLVDLNYHLGGNYYSFDALQAYCFGINIKL